MDFFLAGSVPIREYEDYMEEQWKEKAGKAEEDNYFDSKEFNDLLQQFVNETSTPDNDPAAPDDYGASEDATLDSRIAACQSPEERRRLIILRAKLAVCTS